METARVHHAPRRGGGVAARGTGAVAGDAGDLISPSGFARSERKNVPDSAGKLVAEDTEQ
jgi:hypothetical protein